MAYTVERPGVKGTKYTGLYRDPGGVKRSAGTFRTKREAMTAAHREEEKVRVGSWHDVRKSEITLRDYVTTAWLPSRHIEPSTLAGYQSYLNKQFYPFFGNWQMGHIMPTHVQAWVTKAAGEGLSPASIRKYHMMLHSIFRRAVRDRVITFNPCEETELPKIINRRRRTLTPDEYQLLITAVPDRYQLMVNIAIETGLRWGEFIALRPRHFDFHHATLTIEETIVEVPLRAAPDGQRMINKPYPKNNEWRRMGIRPGLLAQIKDHIEDNRLGSDDLLFATRNGTPISRNTFRTRAWAPAVKASATSATHMHPGYLPAAPTSNPLWTAWATPKSKQPRDTSTLCLMQTNATSPPSAASPTKGLSEPQARDAEWPDCLQIPIN